MTRPPGDDLFADSVMSFGEHLEELRISLARALVGLVVGVAVGFVFADDVVRLIERPLKNALQDYHAGRAVERYSTHLEPEQLTLIQQSGIAPESIEIEITRLLEKVDAILPANVGRTAFTIGVFSGDELGEVDLTGLTRDWVTASEDDDAPAAVLWQALDEDQRTTVRQIAETESPTPAQRTALLDVLNHLVTASSLHQDKAFEDLSQLFRGKILRQSLSAFQSEARAQGTPLAHRRLNRWIITGALAPHLPRPRPELIEVSTWKPVDAQIITLNAQEAFMVWFKAAFLTGFLIASPWVFWQIWMFVAAGLYPHEKGYVYTFLPFSMALFAAGAALAFFGVFPFVLDFLFLYNKNLDIVPNLRLSEWMSLALFLPIGFGISFQLPLVMLLLERIGIFTIESYLSKWRIAVLVICVISMVLTPADPSSMLLMAIPLIILYFGGVGLCRWMPRRESPFGEALDP